MIRLVFNVVALVCVGLLVAEPLFQMSAPGPELKRLNYFVGNWTLEADLQQSPFSPAGKFTRMEHNEWMQGGFFVISRFTDIGPRGSGGGLAVMGYSTEKGVYTYDGFDNMGSAEHATGTFRDGTWIWTNEEKIAGKTYKSRFTVRQISQSTYHFKFDMAPEGGDWAVVMEGKATKTQ